MSARPSISVASRTRFALTFALALAGLHLTTQVRDCPAGMVGAGFSPRTVALGDLNEDTYLDLVAGNADGMVTVHLGRGNRTYDPRVSYSSGATVENVAVADVNGDGHLDVIDACPAIDKIGVRLGAGDGTLGSRTEYAIAKVRGVAVGHFNADGLPDLALAGDNYGLALMVGTGGGVFNAPSFFGVGSSLDLALGDVDGNGTLDVVTATGTGVTVYRGMGSANFMPAVSYATGAARDVALAHLNNDAVLDLAAPDQGNNRVAIWFGNGDGTFSASANYTTSPSPDRVAAGDLNGDNRPDLVVSSSSGSVASVLLNDGTGAFLAKVDYSAGVGNGAIAIGNLDVLAPIDLAITASGQNSIHVMQGNGDGTLVPPAGPVYVWAGPSGQAWDAFSWLPPRQAPSSVDVLVFNRGGTVVVGGVATSSVRQVAISDGTVAECAGLGASTLTITGGTGTDLTVERDSKLVLNSVSNTILCNLASGANAEINGDLEIRGGSNRLQALDVNGIVFQSTGRAIIGSGSSTTPFGNGTGASGLNSVLFHFGSRYIAQTTVSVFGASAPQAVVHFWPGSRFRMDAAFAPAASGRTYADFEYNVPSGSSAFTGGNPLQLDSLIVTQGTFTVAMTGSVSIRGNVVISACGGPNQLLFAPPAPATYRLNGSGRQLVYSTAGCLGNVLRIYASPNVTFDIDNPSGAHLAQGWRTAANFHFTRGNVGNLLGYQVATDSTSSITGASQSTGWFETQLSRRVTADGIIRMDVGDSANYLPVDLDVHGVTSPGYLLAGTLAWDHPNIDGAQLDLDRRVYRRWTLDGSNDATNLTVPTFFSNLDATFPFVSSDVSSGSDPLEFEMRMFHSSGVPWRATTPGTRTATSTQALGLTPAVVDSFSTLVSGRPITPSLAVFDAAESEGNQAAAGTMQSAGAQSAGSLAFRVRLSQIAIVPVTVDYQTVDGTATVADGDYTPTSGTLNFAPGDTALDVVVPFGADATPERNETFGITISNATNATIANASATGTILDDDDLIAPTAMVIYPNGGEVFHQNQQVQLQWTASDNVEVSSVDLYVTGGASWVPVAIGHPNTGSYTWTASGTPSNKMRFRVVAHDDPGHEAIDVSDAFWELTSNTVGVEGDLPLAFALGAPAPNPSPAGRSGIAFALPHAADVRLTVHDVTGRMVAKLADGVVSAGRHQRTWDSRRAASGVYFVRFVAPGFRAERRLVVVR